MPSVSANVDQWVNESIWVDSGNDWSEGWGGPEKQWRGCLLPRIGRFLPAESVLEIAPGFGRWTHFLQNKCDRLIAVDLSANCIEACKRRFSGSPKMSFYHNDGKSLDMVPDQSVDFIFSFDSLVHADADALNGYLSQFKRILKPQGAAFIHHSNYGAHPANPLMLALGRVKGIRKLVWHFRLGGVQPNRHWRGAMSAAEFREACPGFGLRCFEQELVNWGSDYLNDSFSYVARDNSELWPREIKVVENMHFMEEAARIKATPIEKL